MSAQQPQNELTNSRPALSDESFLCGKADNPPAQSDSALPDYTAQPEAALVNTPNIDRLANNGLRYTNMHTTALCSPTRSCILTGRNHHSNGLAAIGQRGTHQ